MNITILLTMLAYLLLMFVVSVWASRVSAHAGGDFLNEYFLGNRSMGGFVLAMTMVATYVSASSFISGPGLASQLGLGWIFLSAIQIPSVFLTLGVLGKKIALISRRIHALTLVDILRARYQSPLIPLLAVLSLLVFFITIMVGQFIGGARLFQAVTGYSYELGLCLFGVTVIAYTAIGGFRAVVLTDAVQGVVMMLATALLLGGVLIAGGGLEAIMNHIAVQSPHMLEPTAGGKIAQPFMLSFWMLVGLGLLGLPQTAVRSMGYRDSKSLHHAMIIGSIVTTFLMLGMHMTGMLGSAVLQSTGNTDLFIPQLTLAVLPPVLAGLFVAGPLAAVMSSVDSLLIMASATLIKDLYIWYTENKATSIHSTVVQRISILTTSGIGILVFIFAYQPPDLIVWINLFSMGGLESTFFFPLVFGLFWKKANDAGALLSMIAGISSFIILTVTKFDVLGLGLHAIVPSSALALLAFLAGAAWGKKTPAPIISTFFA